MYLPKSKYVVRAAEPGEFMTQENQGYSGPVVETFTGACYPGTDPMSIGPRLIPVTYGVEMPEMGFYNIKRIPTKAEYETGKMVRYFVQGKKTQKIIEISPEAWHKYYNPKDLLHIWKDVEWILVGHLATVKRANEKTIEVLEKLMPGIVSSRVLWDPLQFYKSKVS